MDHPRRKLTRKKSISYAKWGYIFIAPFFITYLFFTLIPQFLTVYNSFFESYRVGLKQIGPTFVGFRNYADLFSPDSSGTVIYFSDIANSTPYKCVLYNTIIVYKNKV